MYRRGIDVCCVMILTLVLVGCEHGQIGPVDAATSERLHPDYDTARDAFVEADLAVLASEFIDEYAGQYVVFEGQYLGHRRGAGIQPPRGRPQFYQDIMAAQIGAPPQPGAAPGQVGSAQHVQLLWAEDDRELGRPLLHAAPGSPLRIYAYVLPVGDRAALKTRRNRVLDGFPTPVVLLVDLELDE